MSTIYRNYNELMRARGEMTYLGHQKLLLLVVLQTVNHEETELGYFPKKGSSTVCQDCAFKNVSTGLSKPQSPRQGFRCTCAIEEERRDPK